MPITRLEHAFQLHRQGKLPEAREAYEELLQEDPDQPELLHALAVLLSQQGQLNDSVYLLQQALLHDPNNTTYQQHLANTYLKLGNTNAAIARYQTLLQTDPNSVEIRFNLSLAYLKNNQWADAKKILEQLQQEQPNQPNVLCQLAQIELNNQAVEQAAALLEQCLEHKPEHLMALHELGTIYLIQGKLTEAESLLNQCYQLNPGYDQVNLHLGHCYLRQNQRDVALQHYLKQIEHGPCKEAYYNVAVLLMYQERLHDAISYFEKALEHDEEDSDILLNLGGLYLKAGKYEQASNHYQKAQALDPDNPEIQHILAAITQSDNPGKPPASYLEHLFDQYASHYDQHLQYLKYQAPQLLLDCIELELSPKPKSLQILDLGCGTGLAGELLKPHAKTLNGIDISQEMVTIAKQKELYDALEVGDLHQKIAGFSDIDLMIASDVLTYIGDLSDLFAIVKQQLKPGGHFAFTVEKTDEHPYRLQQTIRYRHHRRYIEELAQQQQFTIITFDNAILRQQKDNPVEGYLVMLQA